MLLTSDLWNILAKRYLNTAYFGTLKIWNKDEYIYTFNHMHGKYLIKHNNHLADIRFLPLEPKQFITPHMKLIGIASHMYGGVMPLQKKLCLTLKHKSYVEYLHQLILQVMIENNIKLQCWHKGKETLFAECSRVVDNFEIEKYNTTEIKCSFVFRVSTSKKGLLITPVIKKIYEFIY